MQKKLCNVTLELSAKPFFDDSEDEMYRVCRKMFGQWRRLTDVADTVSLLLWTADGSEILEYRGNLAQTFEWGYWCGCANHCPRHQPERPGDRENIHLYPLRYRVGVGPRSYAWLKRLIEVIRETGSEITGKPIRVGATFDNGPEFALSDFKFNRHKEIAQAHTLFPNSFVVCTARLHAENRAYAAFPDGIAEGTSLGYFLGSQFREFSRDLGFDYIWFSNGMGFGSETWGITGAIFDKKSFHPEKSTEAAEAMLGFWRDFFAGCPGAQIETRGSNYSAGTEIATDAAPLAKLYRDYKIAPPVNSPWASMNYNTGLEIAAWMSHIAELPDERLPYRFYIHDPWFVNSPWLDRYGREPWDIYLPLAVSRLAEDGRVVAANRIALLSVDDSNGQMPEVVPQEVTPLLLHAALEIAPDAPGPLLWVYPFDEYSTRNQPQTTFAEEQFVGEAIQGGLPLNTVVSTRIWRQLTARGKLIPGGSLPIVPVSAAAAVMPYIAGGGSAIFYGSLNNADGDLLDLLGLALAEPLDGRFTVSSELADEFEAPLGADSINVHSQFDGDGLAEVAAKPDVKIPATASQNGQRRVLTSFRRTGQGGVVGFVRAVLPLAEVITTTSGLDYAAFDSVFHVERLMRHLAGVLGWSIRFRAFSETSKLARTVISRSEGAFRFAIFSLDTTTMMILETPLGAPVMNETESMLEDSRAVVHPSKCSIWECRCFVRQSGKRLIRSKVQPQSHPEVREHWQYAGLKDAEVRFFPPERFAGSLKAVVCGDESWSERLNLMSYPVEWVDSPYGRYALLRHVTGKLYFRW